MPTLRGRYLRRGGTRSVDATLHLADADPGAGDGARYRLTIDGDAIDAGDLGALDVRAPVAGVPRRIGLPDGSTFECEGDDGLDRWLRGRRVAGRGGRLLHAVERRGVLVIGVAALTVAALAAGYRWGLPAATRSVADRLPVSALEAISDGVVETLDESWMTPSALDPDERDAIGARFDALVAALPEDGFDYRLHLRGLDGLANAFALPNGEIVLTDALVALAGGDAEEIDAVLLHEIAHVRERHGVDLLLRSRLLAMGVALGTGSESGFSALSAALAERLLGAAYSREAETEADRFAFDALAAMGRDPASFARIIAKLADPDAAADADPDEGASALGWLSSHPDTAVRAREAMLASERWRRTGPEPGDESGDR